MNFLLTRQGNFLVLTHPDHSIIDESWVTIIYDKLSFIYKSRGNMGQMVNETRYMCKASDDRKSLYLSWGLKNRLVKELKALGCRVWYQDLTDNSKRFDNLAPELENVTDKTFRVKQKECFDAIIQNPCGIIQAPTGFGKTYLLGILCNAFPEEKIHVCTKSVKLAREIYHRLRKCVDSVGMVGGGSKDLDKRVTVFTADSLGYSNGDASFLFFDECHTAAAPSYLEKIMNIYTYSRRYGFTATPTGRSDGADDLLEMLFGPMIFSMTYEDGVKAGLVSKIKVRWLHCSQAPSNGLHCATQVYRNRYCIWENEYRNQLIADDVHQKYGTDTKILILVSTVTHAFALKQFLPEFELNYATLPAQTLTELINKGWCDSTYTPLNRSQKEKLFDDFLSGAVTKVISTDVWNTGIDVPDLSVVYNVSGRVSKILNTQGAGRTSRLFSDKPFGQVIDIRDTFGEYEGFAYSRHKLYQNLGWEQEGFYQPISISKNELERVNG